MQHGISRRGFVMGSAAAGLGLMAAGRLEAEAWRTRLKKAVIVGRPTEADLRPIKDAGFDGVEAGDYGLTAEEAAAARAAAEKLGLRIHSVLLGWMDFNSKDPAAVAKSIAKAEQSLRAAEVYGADAVLLVPCRIGGMPMPEAWDFQIEFDEKNGHLARVAAGDNAKYKAYIEAHDWATDSSREAVAKLIPAAEKAKVVIALENVWNNLWVKPEIFKWFVASFKSPWVKAYLDIGNHVKYAPPEEWIRVLGALLVKLHVKDFKLNADGHGGNFTAIRDGSVNWPMVRKAIDEVGYNGWMTIEDGRVSLTEQNKRLDLIIAGQ